MSPFELVFAVFGMLLGLAIAEVLGGFSRAVTLKRGTKPVRIGWLSPLLGLLVMLDLTTFWLIAWVSRDQIDANYLTLCVVLLMVGTYYLAATLIFPAAPEEWPDFDDWYDKQNRLVVGGLLLANVTSAIGGAVLDALHPLPETPAAQASELASMLYVVGTLGFLVLLIALLIVKGRRWNVALLVSLIVLILISEIAEPYA